MEIKDIERAVHMGAHENHITSRSEKAFERGCRGVK